MSTTEGGSHRYKFDVNGGPAAVTIDLMTADNAYLYLLDKNGSVIESDDNDGPGYNARIYRGLGLGSYQLIVTTRDKGKSADYSLAVQGFVTNLGFDRLPIQFEPPAPCILPPPFCDSDPGDILPPP